jgi:hypothetical protein
MPKSESSRIESLEALLAERRKHETYLAKLEERRAATPEHVYKRLRDEYATKLADLQVRAAMEADALSAGIEEDAAAVAELESRLSSVIEERIEGELRAEVGEYEGKDWSKKLAVLNATISHLEKERDTRAGAFERTRALITEATSFAGSGRGRDGAVAAPSAAQASAPAGSAADTTAPIKEPTTGASDRPASGPSASPMSGGPSFDELAFLNSVVGRASVPPSPAPPPSRVPTPGRSATPPRPQVESPPAAPSAAPPAPAASAAGAPPAPRVSGAVARDAVAAAEAQPAPAPTKEPQAPPRTSAAVPRPAESSFSTPPASADEEPPSPLGRPTPRTSQAIKTLKCQECGTLNYPTEWYCERCGGELAAL